MLGSQGRPVPGRTEGKGMARLLGTLALRSSQGCSVPISSKVVINAKEALELSLQLGRGAAPATHPGHSHGCITQQTASAAAFHPPFLYQLPFAKEIIVAPSGITAITWRVSSPTTLQRTQAPAHPVLPAPQRVAEEGASPGACQSSTQQEHSSLILCLHPGGGQEISAACTQSLCPVMANSARAGMQERGGYAIPRHGKLQGDG